MNRAISAPILGAEPARGGLQGQSNRESDDDYRRVVAVLNDKWRVIVCREGIQWILQHKQNRSQWRGRHYCRTRAGLLDSVWELCGSVDPSSLTVLRLLPDWIDH